MFWDPGLTLVDVYDETATSKINQAPNVPPRFSTGFGARELMMRSIVFSL